MRAIQILMVTLVATFGSAVSAAPMTFEFVCLGNAVESCFAYGEGEIETETDSRFQAFLDSKVLEGNQIVLNSQGGNLGAGVRLGRMIREAGLTALVGEAERENGALSRYGAWPKGGACASACAYAFLGGTTRVMTKGSQLGFHRFYMGSKGASSSAQQVSGQLVSYLVEMGIDPRVFTKASSQGADSMYWVSLEEAGEYDLITPYGYEDFFLEPYGKGVVAAARRKTPPGPYDNVYQVTAYCRGGQAKMLFTATYAPQHSVAFELTTDGQRQRLAASMVTTRSTDSVGYLEVTLGKDEANRLSKAESVATGFDYARVDGGSFGLRLELSDMDRKMLDAAFRLCL